MACAVRIASASRQANMRMVSSVSVDGHALIREIERDADAALVHRPALDAVGPESRLVERIGVGDRLGFVERLRAHDDLAADVLALAVEKRPGGEQHAGLLQADLVLEMLGEQGLELLAR